MPYAAGRVCVLTLLFMSKPSSRFGFSWRVGGDEFVELNMTDFPNHRWAASAAAACVSNIASEMTVAVLEAIFVRSDPHLCQKRFASEGDCKIAGRQNADTAVHGAGTPVVAVVEDAVSLQDLRARGRRLVLTLCI
jgi:hypothetical protein